MSDNGESNTVTAPLGVGAGGQPSAVAAAGGGAPRGPAPPPRRRAPHWLRAVGAVLVWTVALVSVAALTTLVVVPRVAGAEPYTILTGSMEPELPPGTIVVVKPLPFDLIEQGDVVTYQIESGKPMVVTHRVVGFETVDGETRLVTRGDANQAPDVVPVRPAQLRGVVWYHVQWVGYATSILGDSTKEIAVRVIGGALLAYAVFLGVSLLFRRKKVTH